MGFLETIDNFVEGIVEICTGANKPKWTGICCGTCKYYRASDMSIMYANGGTGECGWDGSESGAHHPDDFGQTVWAKTNARECPNYKSCN